MNKPILYCEDLAKSFKDGERSIDILKNINLSIHQGEQIAIVGTSGSGKSTLLQLLGGLDKPTAGRVILSGQDLGALSDKKRTKARNQQLGFVYQFHHLLPEFSALENVAIPLLLAGKSSKVAREEATAILTRVGLSDRLTHRLAQLSGGERQRVAIARALVISPRCLLADEPTGNLDPRTAHDVYDTMLALNKELETSLVIVTHDQGLAAQMDKIYELKEGKLYSDRG